MGLKIFYRCTFLFISQRHISQRQAEIGSSMFMCHHNVIILFLSARHDGKLSRLRCDKLNYKVLSKLVFRLMERYGLGTGVYEVKTRYGFSPLIYFQEQALKSLHVTPVKSFVSSNITPHLVPLEHYLFVQLQIPSTSNMELQNYTLYIWKYGIAPYTFIHFIMAQHSGNVWDLQHAVWFLTSSTLIVPPKTVTLTIKKDESSICVEIPSSSCSLLQYHSNLEIYNHSFMIPELHSQHLHQKDCRCSRRWLIWFIGLFLHHKLLETAQESNMFIKVVHFCVSLVNFCCLLFLWPQCPLSAEKQNLC